MYLGRVTKITSAGMFTVLYDDGEKGLVPPGWDFIRPSSAPALEGFVEAPEPKTFEKKGKQKRKRKAAPKTKRAAPVQQVAAAAAGGVPKPAKKTGRGSKEGGGRRVSGPASGTCPQDSQQRKTAVVLIDILIQCNVSHNHGVLSLESSADSSKVAVGSCKSNSKVGARPTAAY